MSSSRPCSSAERRLSGDGLAGMISLSQSEEVLRQPGVLRVIVTAVQCDTDSLWNRKDDSHDVP